mmetsp:Transcript_15400/g.31657  ORF Transcript_15400/g.31657 Transcript_15400/m.31657 type:complete len:631 (+) Transcript_15400:59-1951(+)
MKDRRTLLLAFLALTAASVKADEPDIEEMNECEQIVDDPASHDDHLFNFHQHDERLDPNKFLKIVYQMMSMRRTDPVKKVTLEFNPILHHLVGAYSMRSTVQHAAADGTVSDTCYDITVQIHDTDECTHEGSSDWMHSCHDSTACVNTEGGYFCACSPGEWAVNGSGEGKCNAGEADSTACCGAVTYDGAPHGDFGCRAAFACHADSCAHNDCDPNASCVAGEPGSNTYSCQCNERYRDVSATATTTTGVGGAGRSCEFVDHCESPDACPGGGCLCRSVVDQTQDGYFCDPLPGFATYVPEAASPPAAAPNKFRLDAEPHLCASQARVELELVGASRLVLTQGQAYEEQGVRISDDSSADLDRRFTTDYSNAERLFTEMMAGSESSSGFAKTCGLYYVTYELATPWIQGHPKAMITREVEVGDVDECHYSGLDADFSCMCHYPAKCVNVVCGTGGFAPSEAAYECVCDNDDFESDGDNGCVRKVPLKVEAPAAVADKASESPDEPASVDSSGADSGVQASDSFHYVQKLNDALDHLGWDADKLHADGLRKYKRYIHKLFDTAHGTDSDLPKDYAWDSPYRTKDLGELRQKCVDRELASAVGAVELSKKSAISLLAHADHDQITEGVLSKL